MPHFLTSSSMGVAVAITISMKCPKCEFVLPDDSDRCERCGADLAREQPRAADTAALSPVENLGFVQPSEEDKRKADWGFVLDQEFDRLYERFKKEEEKQKDKEKYKDEDQEIRWGGFFRRCSAFFIDLAIVFLLCLLLFYLSYVGYHVGLAAHDRAVSDDPVSFLRLALFGYLLLVAGYFVLFHGMDGRTVGKWLLDLRVVGRHHGPITYAQALIRCFGYLLSAFFGIGFIWILLNRKKRGWHDLLARTWVIRESSLRGKES
ncbi:MAG: RDD family protein [Deltaproteobacteria bacterium]|nr:MAG: RDD family protein [Deltaproteobacteria bacterium]